MEGSDRPDSDERPERPSQTLHLGSRETDPTYLRQRRQFTRSLLMLSAPSADTQDVSKGSTQQKQGGYNGRDVHSRGSHVQEHDGQRVRYGDLVNSDERDYAEEQYNRESMRDEPRRLADSDFFQVAQAVHETLAARGVYLQTYDLLAVANRIVNVEGYARRPF